MQKGKSNTVGTGLATVGTGLATVGAGLATKTSLLPTTEQQNPPLLVIALRAKVRKYPEQFKSLDPERLVPSEVEVSRRVNSCQVSICLHYCLLPIAYSLARSAITEKLNSPSFISHKIEELLLSCSLFPVSGSELSP